MEAEIAPTGEERSESQFASLGEERKASAQLISLLEKMVPPEARLILCQFSGDPDTVDDSTKWRPKVWKQALIQENWNIYLCVSAMGRGGIGDKFRRTKECWEGGLVFMVDDVGTKLPMSLVDKLEPTALVETSPGNFQAIYVFDTLVEKVADQEALINNFVDRYCGEEGKKDPGMKGINRVFRPPFGINGKAKYKGEDGRPWRVRLRRFNPEARYTPQAIAAAFGITLEVPLPTYRSNRKPGDREARIEDFRRIFELVLSAGIVKDKRRPFNRAGWAQVHCPWRDGHTGKADTGAAIRWPATDNDFYGAFRCHHGHCEHRTWSDFCQVVADGLGDDLNEINAAAPDLTGMFDG